MTATVAINVPGLATTMDEPDDPFRLEVRIVEDTRPAEQTACATNNGCAATCASACASAP
jgi:FxLD family lantipeptide